MKDAMRKMKDGKASGSINIPAHRIYDALHQRCLLKWNVEKALLLLSLEGNLTFKKTGQAKPY